MSVLTENPTISDYLYFERLIGESIHETKECITNCIYFRSITRIGLK